MEVLLTEGDWVLILESLRATIRHRQSTDNYLDDTFRRAQVEEARETLRRVEALREQISEESR